jgi:hypothetical protein
MDLTPDLFANSIDDYSRDLRLAKWGSRVQFAQHQSRATHVRFGPKADIEGQLKECPLFTRKQTFAIVICMSALC